MQTNTLTFDLVATIRAATECRDIHGWGESIDAAAAALREEIEGWRAQGWELDR